MIYRKDNLLTPGHYTYHYIGGTSTLWNYMEIWIKFFEYNFGYTFEKVKTGGFIRIGFDNTIHSQATVGMDHFLKEDIATYPWTVNIKPSELGISEEHFHLIAIHELGHVIGLEHEHLHPDNFNNTDWPSVREHLKECCDYSDETLDILENGVSYPDYVWSETYNPRAIMGYHVVCDHTISGRNCGHVNTEMELREVTEIYEALNSPNRRALLTSKEWKEIFSLEDADSQDNNQLVSNAL